MCVKAPRREILELWNVTRGEQEGNVHPLGLCKGLQSAYN